MSSTLVTGVILGSSKTGLAIGYRLVDTTSNVAVAFTTTNVQETNVPGNYNVLGGILLPDGFAGRVVWGTSGQDLAEEWVGPTRCTASAAAGSSSSSVSGTVSNFTDYHVKGALVPFVTTQTLLGEGQISQYQIDHSS